MRRRNPPVAVEDSGRRSPCRSPLGVDTSPATGQPGRARLGDRQHTSGPDQREQHGSGHCLLRKSAQPVQRSRQITETRPAARGGREAIDLSSSDAVHSRSPGAARRGVGELMRVHAGWWCGGRPRWAGWQTAGHRAPLSASPSVRRGLDIGRWLCGDRSPVVPTRRAVLSPEVGRPGMTPGRIRYSRSRRETGKLADDGKPLEKTTAVVGSTAEPSIRRAPREPFRAGLSPGQWRGAGRRPRPRSSRGSGDRRCGGCSDGRISAPAARRRGRRRCCPDCRRHRGRPHLWLVPHEAQIPERDAVLLEPRQGVRCGRPVAAADDQPVGDHTDPDAGVRQPPRDARDAGQRVEHPERPAATAGACRSRYSLREPMPQSQRVQSQSTGSGKNAGSTPRSVATKRGRPLV